MSATAPVIDQNERDAPTAIRAPTVVVPVEASASELRLRRVTVHIDDAESVAERLDSAQALAARLDAQILACYCAVPSAKQHALQVGLTMRGIDRCDEEDLRRSDAAYAAFVQACGPSSDIAWLDLSGESEDAFDREALYSDYLVLQRPDRMDHVAGVSTAFVDRVLVRSGRPAIVLPPHGRLARTPRTMAIAWTESPAAARAVASAMPILREAKDIHIIGCGDNAYASVAGLATRFEAQGWMSRSHIVEDVKGDGGLSLLDCARRAGADLLVMGCFGHRQSWERFMGGASRTALDRSPIPLLMAH